MCGRTACTLSRNAIGKCCRDLNDSTSTSNAQTKHSGAPSTSPSTARATASATPSLVSGLLAARFMGREDLYRQSHNTTPKQYTPVFVMEDGEVAVRFMQWGLVPSWHKKGARDFSMNMINARIETLADIASYRNALQRGQRCVVLAEGYYEWQVRGRDRQPYYIYPTGESGLQADDGTPLFAFAGVYDMHRPSEKWLLQARERGESAQKDAHGAGTKTKSASPRKDTRKDKGRKQTTLHFSKAPSSSIKDGSALDFDGDFDDDGDRDGDSVYDGRVRGEDCMEDGMEAKREAEGDGCAVTTGSVESCKRGVRETRGQHSCLYTYSIITQAASPKMKWLHLRMPAILETKADVLAWLDSGRVPVTTALKHIAKTPEIDCYPVSAKVGSIKNTGPECRQRIKLPSKANSKIMSWLKTGTGESPPKRPKKTVEGEKQEVEIKGEEKQEEKEEVEDHVELVEDCVNLPSFDPEDVCDDVVAEQQRIYNDIIVRQSQETASKHTQGGMLREDGILIID